MPGLGPAWIDPDRRVIIRDLDLGDELSESETDVSGLLGRLLVRFVYRNAVPPSSRGGAIAEKRNTELAIRLEIRSGRWVRPYDAKERLRRQDSFSVFRPV